MDENVLLLSIFAAVEEAHAFSAFMPSYFTIRKFATDPRDAARLRSGYTPAVAFGILLGGVVSLLTKSAIPLAITVLVAVFMIAMYENGMKVEPAPEVESHARQFGL